MRITTRGRYALRASLALAEMGKDGVPVSISSLSEKENISSVFLEQIFFRLRRAGIVSSIRGPGGGFSLAQPIDKITVKNILDAAGEELELTYCDKHSENCYRLGECLSHNVLQHAHDLVNDYLSSITLSSVLEQANETAHT